MVGYKKKSRLIDHFEMTYTSHIMDQPKNGFLTGYWYIYFIKNFLTRDD